MRRIAVVVLAGLLSAAARPQTVRLKALADIWLSDATEQERNSSAGKHQRFKLKSIEEMAAIRFDASAVRGREVLKAALFLHRAGSDQLRYIRVSTVGQDWEEGATASQYGPASGATYYYADVDSKRPWAWPGSQFCDVIMTSGNTLATWAERKELADGWLSVALTPELIYALAVGDTDGLALMDGGTIGLHNNFIHSLEAGQFAPYIEVELGGRLPAAPATPRARIEPAADKAHAATGALKFTIEPSPDAFCWRISINGKPVERWRIPHPKAGEPTVFWHDELPASQRCDVEIVAVSAGGQQSPPLRTSATASPALAGELSLATFREPKPLAATPAHGPLRVWALPGLVKISPENGSPMADDLAGGDFRSANAVWDGKTIRLFGARGEYVSFQLCIERTGATALSAVKVACAGLAGPGGFEIEATEIELYRNWYAKNRDGQWQPAYCIPLAHGAAFDVPDGARGLPSQQNQTLYADVYVPKTALAGVYSGRIRVAADGVQDILLPLELRVYDFELPDELAFWPELNAYHMPKNAHSYYRLAHQHRSLCNYYIWQPRLSGSGKDIRVIWDDYDRDAGPLLSGEAFRGNRRSGVPVECMYLPYADSWPTPLTKDTYNYQGYWPGRGEDWQHIIEHYLKAPYIGNALSQSYKDAFLSVQRQFIEHFREKGWQRTEMQCFYGGKNTHRIQFGVNMWWTTDEPHHWDDWLALQYFNILWRQGRGGADPQIWASRADISRPQWQGRVMEGVLQVEYIGGFTSPGNYRRCRILNEQTGVKIRTYGGTNADNASNTQSVVMLMNMWLNGANGHLPWQTLGSDKSLDINDSAGSGSSLLVPGDRFGLDVVGDMRLKALRDGEQIIEYLAILAHRYGLQREQVQALVLRAAAFSAGRKAGAGADDADALVFSTLKTWEIAELRRGLAELIVR